jgi:hypothetical protein
MTTDLDALDLLPLRDGDRPERDHDPRAVQPGSVGPPTQNPPCSGFGRVGRCGRPRHAR